MAGWTLDDIPWERFDASRLDSELVRLAKAAALVEYNGAAYARHLCKMFAGDTQFQQSAERWGREEVQHGLALGRWAALADADFDFAAAFARFRAGYRIDFDSARSRRGSPAGEMIARCIVETGTSSYYTALKEASAEPVLREICRRIAADELRHYRLFYKNLGACLARERFGRWARLRVALGRLIESEDDELAYAYYAANEADRPYDRRRYSRAYARRAFALYRPHHIEHGVAMILKAVGLTPNGRLGRMLAALTWRALRWRAGALAKSAA
ncbi:MAG TPA: ferritin-like domain-containing protein [Stellaceae bacterium]|nr:ferritin-like domain-containing protein [Stellaceae bacterium]